MLIKRIAGIVAALGLLAAIGFSDAVGMTLMQRAACSLLGLLGLSVGAAVAGALKHRGEGDQAR